MTNPITAIDLAEYDTVERRQRMTDRAPGRFRLRAAVVLESWSRRLRATAPRSGGSGVQRATPGRIGVAALR